MTAWRDSLVIVAVLHVPLGRTKDLEGLVGRFSHLPIFDRDCTYTYAPVSCHVPKHLRRSMWARARDGWDLGARGLPWPPHAASMFASCVCAVPSMPGNASYILLFNLFMI